MKELSVIREAITAAMQESSDYPCADPAEVRKMVEDNTHLGRLDPGQWCPEALVIAHTEEGLPSPHDCEFWDRVEAIASRKGCEVYYCDVTHFSVGFFRKLNLAPDVATLIQKGSDAAAENCRHRLEYALESNNISSPIEQLFFTCWEISRLSSAYRHDPASCEIFRYVLYPQFPIKPDAGEQYLIDFAVLRFDADRYRQMVTEWHERQDPYSDGNWIADPYPGERDERCSLNLKVAIELDSYTHHVEGLSPADFEYQKRRERCLQHGGWTVFRFCGREVNREPMKCVDEVRRYLMRNKASRTQSLT